MRMEDRFHPYAAITILFWSLAYVLTGLLGSTLETPPGELSWDEKPDSEASLFLPAD